MFRTFLMGAALTLSISADAADKTYFQRIQLSDTFICEGAHYADFNRDGKMDVVAGPYWFAGPDFKQRHEFTAPSDKPYDGAKGYSDYFLTYTYDFNNDGWKDILVYSWPGKETAWYENPHDRKGHWMRHVVFDITDNESPDMIDVTGDGKPELLCHSRGQLGFVELNWSDPTRPGTYRAISPKDEKKYFRYTHGYGAGDINGDGQVDILDKEGWWEQPAKGAPSDQPWTQHKFFFAPEGMRGGAHMLVYDVNGDGKNDVITSWDAHGYGLAWYEQTREGNKVSFKENILVNTEPSQNKYGVKFTQIHSLFLMDMNGDGLKDFVTGKRFWAHGPTKDAEPDAPAVLYWFELVRKNKTADFIPHLIDDNSGVGTQITAGDLNGDGLPDVISGNKKGVHVFLQQKAK